MISSATSLLHVLHPLTPMNPLREALHRKIAGIVLFILGSLVTCGGLFFFYLGTAYQKQYTIKKLLQAKKQIKKLETINDLSEKDKQQLKEIGGIFKRSIFSVKADSELHQFHERVTDLTIRFRHRTGIKEIWMKFLKSFHGVEIKSQNGKVITLDFAPEMTLHSNPILQPGKVFIEKLDTSQLLKKDIQDITEIFDESFSFPYNRAKLKALLCRKDRIFVVARDALTKRIEGLTGCHLLNDQTCYIFKVSRRANAAKRGIGNSIFEFLAKEYFSKYPAKLQVHKSNFPAINLYNKFGFQIARSFQSKISKHKVYEMKRAATTPKRPAEDR